MEAATSTLHHQPFGLGPQAPNLARGAQPAPEAQQQAAPGPSGATRPDQQHRKPFFYIQPPQPYLPVQSVQWPLPLPLPPSYSPYFGFPGLGYGMPMMPPYQPSPYMEPPSFVLPHTHLHLVDYRRMLNPQYYQTMAYHARRFRYQHNGAAREVASCEVQTEPLSGSQRTSTPGAAGPNASAAAHLRNGSDPPAAQPPSPAVAVARPERPTPELQDGSRTPPSSSSSSSSSSSNSSSSFLIQTEEVRIECCSAPVGLQLLREAAEASHRFSQTPAADQLEQSRQACPDILLVGSEKVPELEEGNHVSATFDFTSADDDVEETRSEKDTSVTQQGFDFKVAHMPFDPKYLEELQKMEATVWSMEDTLLPSPDSVIQNGCAEFPDEAAEVPSADALNLREEELIPVVEMPPLLENKLEPPAEEGLSAVHLCLTMDVPTADAAPAEQGSQSEETQPSLFSSESPLMADGEQHGHEASVQDHQDTSFESLPTYLPSTSWLTDLDSSYYWSKMPATPKKQSRAMGSRCPLEVPSRRRKLEMEFKEPPSVGKTKERYKPKGKTERRSLSDHECFHRSLGENLGAPKRERLCARCLLRTRMFSPAALILKRKAVPFQQWNDDLLLPTCDSCKSHTQKRLRRKGSMPDARGPRHGHDTEGESSENGCGRAAPKWKAGNIKRPLASKQNLEKQNHANAAVHRKPREKNCTCHEAQRRLAAWERPHHCPHGNAIREMDENCAVPAFPLDKRRSVEQIYATRRMPGAEKWWRCAVTGDADGPRSDGGSQHTNKHKTSQSQGTRRKDTRC